MSACAVAETVFAEFHAGGRDLRLEYQWIGSDSPGAPLLVFLHEGLGSVSMWKDWPECVCAAAGCRGLVYSRYGYGQSTPRPPAEKRPVDFMHIEAREVLPALLLALGVDARRDKPVLFGHSDGGSIALLYAAMHPDAVAGVVAAAPHILVEDMSVASIAQARQAYLDTDLRARLGAITRTRIRRSGAGTTSGWTRLSAAGTWTNTCPASPAPCLPSRARTTNTAAWRRYAAYAGSRPRPNCWNCPTAATRRTRTSQPALSRPSPALSAAWKNPADHCVGP
jgi:pimeloyl-ACP methyl ester carboxylesterase